MFPKRYSTLIKAVCEPLFTSSGAEGQTSQKAGARDSRREKLGSKALRSQCYKLYCLIINKVTLILRFC